jgi:hypothetical protein
MLIIFFDIKGTVHKEFDLAGQQVNSAYYCDVLLRLRENMRRLCPKLSLQKQAVPSRQRTASHFVFHRGILTESNMTFVPTHPTFL